MPGRLGSFVLHMSTLICNSSYHDPFYTPWTGQVLMSQRHECVLRTSSRGSGALACFSAPLLWKWLLRPMFVLLLAINSWYAPLQSTHHHPLQPPRLRQISLSWVRIVDENVFVCLRFLSACLHRCSSGCVILRCECHHTIGCAPACA